MEREEEEAYERPNKQREQRSAKDGKRWRERRATPPAVSLNNQPCCPPFLPAFLLSPAQLLTHSSRKNDNTNFSPNLIQSEKSFQKKQTKPDEERGVRVAPLLKRGRFWDGFFNPFSLPLAIPEGSHCSYCDDLLSHSGLFSSLFFSLV
jgi:hypothetical protein